MKSLASIAWTLVWIGAAIYLALTLWLGLTGLTYPYQLDYGEGIVLWFAQQLAHGQPIYKGLIGLPYASSNYPPFGMALFAALMPIFGEGYLGGRLLNFAAALIVAALIYQIVRTETRQRTAGALGALLFLGTPYIYHWVPLDRVDLLGLAFTFGGVYFVWRWERMPRLVYFWLYTFAFLLALYTKQTLFAAPAAAFIALWLRDKRAALTFAVVLGASGGAIYLALDTLTRGAFSFGLIESNATTFLPEQLFDLLKNFALTFPILIALAAWAWFSRVRAKKIGVLEIYAVTALAVVAMSGRVGAWENYFFEAIAAMCVWAGFAVHAWHTATQPLVRRAPIALPLALIVQLGLMGHDPRIAVDLMAQAAPANLQLAHLLKHTSGIIISEDMGALATSGKPVDYYTYQYSMLARSGKWDQAWELNGLRDGTFPLVILERGTREDVDHYRRFTREFVSALDRYYAETQTIGNYAIYTPAPPLRLQAANFGDRIALVGSTWPNQLAAGTTQVTIVWQAQHSINRHYTAFVHLENANGDKIAQEDHEPLKGMYPTTRWAANEMVRDSFALNVPHELLPGQYVVRVGWYDTDTGDRLAVPGSSDNTVIIAEYTIR